MNIEDTAWVNAGEDLPPEEMTVFTRGCRDGRTECHRYLFRYGFFWYDARDLRQVVAPREWSIIPIAGDIHDQAPQNRFFKQ